MRVAQSTETANQVSAGNVTALPNNTHALVAQLDRAPDFESGGRGFESLRARQQIQRFMVGNAFTPPFHDQSG